MQMRADPSLSPPIPAYSCATGVGAARQGLLQVPPASGGYLAEIRTVTQGLRTALSDYSLIFCATSRLSSPVVGSPFAATARPKCTNKDTALLLLHGAFWDRPPFPPPMPVRVRRARHVTAGGLQQGEGTPATKGGDALRCWPIKGSGSLLEPCPLHLPIGLSLASRI